MRAIPWLLPAILSRFSKLLSWPVLVRNSWICTRKKVVVRKLALKSAISSFHFLRLCANASRLRRTSCRITLSLISCATRKRYISSNILFQSIGFSSEIDSERRRPAPPPPRPLVDELVRAAEPVRWMPSPRLPARSTSRSFSTFSRTRLKMICFSIFSKCVCSLLRIRRLLSMCCRTERWITSTRCLNLRIAGSTRITSFISVMYVLTLWMALSLRLTRKLPMCFRTHRVILASAATFFRPILCQYSRQNRWMYITIRILYSRKSARDAEQTVVKRTRKLAAIHVCCARSRAYARSAIWFLCCRLSRRRSFTAMSSHFSICF
mmetsp:Transcript_40638/g.95506  ORF Transcript_40638/g.95506 Transcript_40638/m.95506 type:complete len:323 (-) Transcript_40638:1160-2128(-)